MAPVRVFYGQAWGSRKRCGRAAVKSHQRPSEGGRRHRWPMGQREICAGAVREDVTGCEQDDRTSDPRFRPASTDREHRSNARTFLLHRRSLPHPALASPVGLCFVLAHPTPDPRLGRKRVRSPRADSRHWLTTRQRLAICQPRQAAMARFTASVADAPARTRRA